MPIENWKWVKNYEGLYEVSNTGYLKSIKREIVNKNGVRRIINGKVLKQKNNGQGYLFISLCKNNKQYNYYIHRLVAETFIDNPENKRFVNHKNGNKADNHAENLEWVTHSENVQHAYKVGLNKHTNERHFMATGVIDNELGKEYGSIKEWAEARNINYSTARNIANGYSTLKNVDKTKIIILKPDRL